MNISIKNPPKHHDVIVIGGGPAGCAAAIASARMGADTLVIEATTCLGGMGTSGLVSKWAPFDDGEKVIYRSIPLEIMTRYKKAAGIDEDKWHWVNLYPEIVKRLYDEMLSEAGAKVLFSSQVVDTVVADGNIQSVIVANKAGLTPYTADIYIDCTGDADVAARSGVPFEKGDEDGTMQHGSLCFIIAGVQLDKRRNQTLNSNPEDGLWQRIITEGHYPILTKHFIPAYQGTHILYVNAGDICDLDPTDPENVSAALSQGRKLAETYLAAIREYEPEAFADASIVATAPSMGVRESRRIEGDYRLTLDDYIARRSFPDEISRNSYWLDCHDEDPSKGLDVEMYGPGDSHGIPWRCLLPKGLDNLVVAGRSISMDRMVLASVRVMPNCLAMGEAAGIGAALASKSKFGIRAVDVQQLLSHIH